MIFSLDLDDIDFQPTRRPAPLSTRLSYDIQQPHVKPISFLSPKAASIANSRNFAAPLNESIYSKFKSKIVQEKLTSNKNFHLQLKQQNQAIESLRQQINQNRSVLSFKSKNSTHQAQIGKTMNQLQRIEKTYLKKNTSNLVKRGVNRYMMQKKTISNKQNEEAVKIIEFTEEQLNNLKELTPSLQNKIKSMAVSNNSLKFSVKNLQEVNQRLQNNNRVSNMKIKQLNQQLRNNQVNLQQALDRNSSLEVKYEQLYSQTEQLIEKERLKCLVQIDLEYQKQGQDLLRLSI